MHHDELELLSLGEVWHWDDNKGGWLDPELCANARREEVEYTRRHKMYTRVHREVCLRETGKAPIWTGWAETDRGNQGSPTCARGGSRRKTRRTRGQSCTRRRRRWRRRKWCRRRSLRVNVEERLWRWLTCAGRTSTLQHEEEYSSNCRQKITRQVTNTCAGCCNTACTAHATPHKDWEEEIASTLAHACGKSASRCHRARGRHHDRWRAICGGLLHQNDVRKI